MKKAIWILFVTLALVWTGGAFLAAGLARWTSDAIASDRLAQTTHHVALSSERVAKKLTDATGRVTEQAAAAVTQAVDGAVSGAEQQPIDGATNADGVPADSAPVLPPLPPWVKQWLAPDMVQSIEEWGAWAKSAANVGKAVVADAANVSAGTVPEAVSQSTTMAVDAAVQAAKASADLSSAEADHKTDGAVAPWLAKIVGWLVPIVWVIWGIGLILGFLLTLVAQSGLRRFMAAHT